MADVGHDTTSRVWLHRARSRFGGRFDKYDIKAATDTGDIRHWDVAPPPEYFEELFRVSKNQIIWGGNYFGLPGTRCFVIWRKTNIPIEGFSISPVEYAWTSFDKNAAFCRFNSAGGQGRGERFHPTQKPVALYSWLLEKFAKPGDKILDTHAGSASSMVACIERGYEYVGYELDADYHAKATERVNRVLANEQYRLPECV